MGAITHKKVSAVPDDPDTSLVRPSDWNDVHDFSFDITDITGLSTALIPPGTGNELPYKNGSTFGATPGSSVAVATGVVTVKGLAVAGATVPSNGVYLGNANQLNFSTVSISRMSLNSAGSLVLGSTSMASGLTVNTNVNGGMTLLSNNTFGAGFTLNSSTGQSFQFFSTGSGNNAGWFGVYSVTRGSTPFAVFSGSSGTAGALVGLQSTGTLGWSSNSSTAIQPAGLDTGFSRVSAGLIAAGNGVQGSATGAIRQAVPLIASTAGSGAPNVITNAFNGTVYTNEGSAAMNYHTLPTAARGNRLVFVVQDADGMRIVAATGDTIRIAGSVSAVGGYIESTTIGSVVELVAVNATEWVATSSLGAWTVV